MKRKIWDVYAPVYNMAMRSDRKNYAWMYDRIAHVIYGKDVLEIATGPGLLALNTAEYAKTMTATDYSEGMIREAEKNNHPDNLVFEVADAEKLPYEDSSFDVVMMANALHIMNNPEKALQEVKRVLKPEGIFIAPNFVNHGKSFISRLWSGILTAAGISFKHQWTKEQYLAFLDKNGWKVRYERLLPARITILYTECEVKNES